MRNKYSTTQSKLNLSRTLCSHIINVHCSRTQCTNSRRSVHTANSSRNMQRIPVSSYACIHECWYVHCTACSHRGGLHLLYALLDERTTSNKHNRFDDASTAHHQRSYGCTSPARQIRAGSAQPPPTKSQTMHKPAASATRTLRMIEAVHDLFVRCALWDVYAIRHYRSIWAVHTTDDAALLGMFVGDACCM